ncbi:MAG: PTS sugar transporter subunit IIC [Thermodesulfobacteriota bacterium]|nr:PTS sugar transporter subunit IIC [Thermodesulfobacteriota bacterium]
MIASIIISIIIGSILWLDRTFLFQFLVSRPVIIGCILGFIMKDITTGLLVGASLELLWLNAPPVGAHIPQDNSFCAIVAIPVACTAAMFLPTPCAAGLALVVSIPTATLGSLLDSRIRRSNERFLHSNQPDKYTEMYIGSVMRKAILRAFSYALVAIGSTTTGLCYMVYLIGDGLPDFLESALSYLPYISILIGLVGIIRSQRPLKTTAFAFCLGISLVILIRWIH